MWYDWTVKRIVVFDSMMVAVKRTVVFDKRTVVFD